MTAPLPAVLGFSRVLPPRGVKVGVRGCDAARVGGFGRARGILVGGIVAAHPGADEAQAGWNREAVFFGVPQAREMCWHSRLRARSLTGELPWPFAFLLRHLHPQARG